MKKLLTLCLAALCVLSLTACRDLFDEPVDEKPVLYLYPETEMEVRTCDAFAAALDLNRVSVTADFFDLGGTSLSVALLVSRLSDVSVHEAGAIAWQMPFDDDQYHRLLSAAGLSVSWSRTMQKRRLSGKIEDSSRRLWGK